MTVSKQQKKGSALSAPQITYQYVGPECNAIVLPDNTNIVPGEVEQKDIPALLLLYPCLTEYWVVVDNPS